MYNQLKLRAQYEQQTIDEVLHLYRKGHPPCYITEKTGVPAATIGSWVRKHGIPLQYVNKSNKKKDYSPSLLTLNAIASEILSLDVNDSTFDAKKSEIIKMTDELKLAMQLRH